MAKKRIGIIGVTGSVGSQAAAVAQLNKDIFEVVFVTAHNDTNKLDFYADKLNAGYRILTSESGSWETLQDVLKGEHPDIVLHAASGLDAVESVYYVVDNGINIALANKESIVTAGDIIKEAAERSGSKIVPVDSEHSAIFQCLRGQNKKYVEKIVLTASGGPFRKLPAESLRTVSPADALKHPNWNMGKKISVDSATMMNKGLELIEAKYLFDVEPSKLDVVIHPESIIHSYVTFIDGSVIAQMGEPNMQIPIAYALGFPERIHSGVAAPDFTKIGTLSFEKPDLSRFQCLQIAISVLNSASNALMTAMNAANEAAVKCFLNGEISFADIPKIVEIAVNECDLKNAANISEAVLNNRLALTNARNIIAKYVKPL